MFFFPIYIHREQLERIIEPRTFRDEIRTFKLGTTISNPVHRAHVAPIFLRILYGRLQLSNKAFASAVFTNLAACSSSEFHMFLEMLLIPLSDDCILPSTHCEQTSTSASTSLVASVRDLRSRVRRTCHGEHSSISWPKLQALSRVLNHVLDYMGHRLSTTSLGLDDENSSDSAAHDDADILLRLGLCLTAMTQTVRDLKWSATEIGQITYDNQLLRLPAAAQVKRVRSTGVRLLEHLFTSRILLSEHFWDCPERLDAVKDVCLHQSLLNSLLKDSTIVKSHLLLTLALPWSITSQLADSLLGGAALETLMKLLSFRKLNSSVVECILEVVTNLLFSLDVQNVGRHLIGPHHPRLIAYLHDRMKQLSQQKTVRLLGRKHGSLRLQREFRILAYLATPITMDSANACVTLTGAEADQLLQGLLSLLTRANLRQSTSDRVRLTRRPLVNSDASAVAYESQLMSLEAVEAALVRAVTQLIQSTDNLKANLTRVIQLFARLDSRVCRSLLCQAVGAGVRRIPPMPLDVLQQLTGAGTASTEPHPFRRLGPYLTELSDDSSNNGSVESLVEDLLSRLNSWEPNRLDQPDSARREHAFGILSELVELLGLEQAPEQTVYLHLGGLNCALHTLIHADLQLRDAALDYCLHLATIVSSKGHIELSWPYRTLILGCLWSGLLRTLRQSLASGPKRLHLLRLLNGLVHAFREFPRFMPLALLSDFHSSTVDFYSSLQSGTVSRQAYAIRRLALFLRNPLTIVSKHRISSVRSTLSLADSEFVIPERDLHDLFLPILQFYLNPQLQSNMEDSVTVPEQKRLLEHCLDALGALATYLSWPVYQKLLASYLNKLKTATNSLLAARLVIVLIDAFQPPAWSAASGKLDSIPDDAVDIDKPHMCAVKCRKFVQSELNQNQPDEHKSILNFMLSVCKQLEPYIAKPYEATSKPQGRTSTSASKTFRISLAICLVSLLRRLPAGYLESRLPHLVLRVVDVLRPSQTLSPRTRSEAVKSLTRISRMLGPGKALDSLVNVVSQQLGRGYASQQIRLFSLHKILAEVESAIVTGELAFKAGQLDTVGRILTVHYLDELVGSLAEEMDSRRLAGHSLSSIQTGRLQTDTQSLSSAHLGGSNIVDLPEATGLKAPEGLTRLCRLLSHTGLMRLFEDIQKAICAAAMGKTLKRSVDVKSDDEITKGHTGDSLSVEVSCGLRFRNRALARLEVTLARLPTRNGMFTARQSECLQADGLVQLASLLISKNISEVLSVDPQREDHLETRFLKQKKSTDGWVQPRSALLEPRWNYLEIEPEPTRERNSLSAQSELTQAHLLVGCGLQILVGLLRYRWLKHGNVMDMTSLGNCIPLILDCMRSKYVRVSGAALRCLNLLMVIATSRSSSLIPQFSDHLHTAGERLFDLLTTHPGLLSTKTAAADMYAQQFASNLYRALASLVRHQTSYPLSRSQLLTLLNSVDVELTRDAATTPSLSLLQAILQRRLRDPTLQKEETDFLALCGDPELSVEFTNRSNGLVVAKSADRDQNQVTGAGGGARLLDLVDRVQHLAITSPSEKIRADSRCCLITFLLNYPHKAKFVQSFVAFCLRQLEYKKPTGRLSAVSLLTGLVSDLPISRLTANHLDEAILVSVGAAVERESVRSIRVGLLAVVRILFTRLPAQTAEAHFRDYLLAFTAAPAVTRCSARLLGLQLIGVVLDLQPCLSVKKCRPLLIRLLGTDTLPTAAKQLYQAVLSSPAVRSMSGVSVLFGNTELCPAEEVEVAKAATEDADWVAELSCTSALDQMDVDSTGPTIDSEVEENVSQRSITESDDATGLDEHVDSAEEASDVEREALHFEEAEENARLTCDSLIGSMHMENQRMCKSAVDNHYFLVACTLEFALQLVHRLVHADTDGTDSELVLVSATMVPVWRCLVGFHQTSSTAPPDSSTVFQLPTNIQKLCKRYATLFKTTGGKNVRTFPDSDHWSLLCAGHRGVREWASRCLVPLLRLEVVANQNLMLPENALLSESVGLRFKSAFFCELRRKPKLRIFLLERLLQDSLFQLEHDAREPLNEEWSDALVANLIHLGQLLHLTVGRKPVLRLFRRANRIALDELNCRPHCYIQRTLTLKLITGLLLRLPHPQSTELSNLLFRDQTQGASDADETSAHAPAYVAYVRAASRHLAREFRQRERLTFVAAASVFAVHDEDAEAQASSARIRLGGICLSREQSARARARRKKTQARGFSLVLSVPFLLYFAIIFHSHLAMNQRFPNQLLLPNMCVKFTPIPMWLIFCFSSFQARLRRALMSGTVRPETAQSLVAAAAASRAHAGPDQLIHMIEATETALSEGLGDGNRQLVHSLCAEASLGAKARQQVHRVKKAARTALGLVWRRPAMTESDVPSVSVKTDNQRRQTKRKLKALQCSKSSTDCETATKRQRST
ncbi:U3 small nucleolar RNA-associated protein 20 [Paragonimus westermani]|uniref:U3 small nucleolar RNA-associated protein 20 n=1 Tax=Paragonimus westermani TaxID=34504 RepID=A0A5J4NG35_9TREM|nr:U3 small nucleolar RNA-associated protein 20 [Paragonimus westermani]